MELSAVSGQHSAKDLFFLVLADSRQLMADRAHRKTAVLGWALIGTIVFGILDIR
jgi:hypothetical protein